MLLLCLWMRNRLIQAKRKTPNDSVGEGWEEVYKWIADFWTAKIRFWSLSVPLLSAQRFSSHPRFFSFLLLIPLGSFS